MHLHAHIRSVRTRVCGVRLIDPMRAPLPGQHRSSGPHSGAGQGLWCWVVTGFTPSSNVHTVAPTTASCHHAVQRATQEHQSRVTQRRGILPWWSKAAAGSLLVSFILKPSHAVSAGWWQTLVHKPHFTWAFTYAKGIAPMGKKKAIFCWKIGQGASSESKHIE